MKKVIKGKVYDTDTAEFIGSRVERAGGPEHVCEALYRKRTGEFFLHGEGGPLSRYASQDGSGWIGGELITPVDYSTAESWAKESLSSETFSSVFEVSPDANSRTVISASMASSSVEIARRAASEKGLSLSAYLESLILNQ